MTNVGIEAMKENRKGQKRTHLSFRWISLPLSAAVTGFTTLASNSGAMSEIC